MIWKDSETTVRQRKQAAAHRETCNIYGAYLRAQTVGYPLWVRSSEGVLFSQRTR